MSITPQMAHRFRLDVVNEEGEKYFSKACLVNRVRELYFGNARFATFCVTGCF